MEKSTKKRIKIIKVDAFTNEVFKIKNGETYDVQHEAKGEKRHGYLIYTKEKRAIVMYSDQVELLNK